jgi:uncharacterized protein (DUF927 family)
MDQQPIKKAPHAAECFGSDCTLRKGGLQDEPASHADENGSLEPEVAAGQEEPPAQTTANGADEASADEKAQDRGVPFMVTQAMKARLRELGFKDEEIAKMNPAQAHARLKAWRPPTEAQQPAHATMNGAAPGVTASVEPAKAGSPRAETERFLSLVHQPDEVREVRALETTKGSVDSGYYNDLKKLAEDALHCTTELKAHGIYITINPCQPALLNRAINRLRYFVKKDTTADANILRRRVIPLDFDPIRAGGVSGIPATEEEHAWAFAKAYEVRDFLITQGFPATAFIIIDSGNGTYLLVAIDLPNDKESTGLVKHFIEYIDLMFSDEHVQVDLTMHNAARIIRLPGTLNRKGDSTKDRPWRRARIIEAPTELEIVPREAVERIAQLLPKPETKRSQSNNRTNGARFDLDTFIQQHGIAVKRTKPLSGGGSILILEHCVFDETHRGSSAAILQFPSGAQEYKCQHYTCVDRRWADVRELYEPGYQQRKNSRTAEFTIDGEEPLRKLEGEHDSGDDTVKRPFRLTDKEVLYAEESDDGGDKWVKVCSRLKIAAQTCNERSEDWGRLLEFPDNKGLIHYWAMPAELLGGDRSAYESELYRLGLTIAPGLKSSYRLKEYIQTQGDQSSFVRSVSTLGWHGKSFVYPDQIFGAAGDEPIVYQPLYPVEHDFRTRGTLQDWQEHIAKPCEGNSRLIVTVSMAFAAPLLYHTKSESGGLHWRGDSSRGKTTLAIVGGSVVGGGGHEGTFLRQWRATVNGLEGVATAHCDSFLALDEIAQILPRDAGLAAYTLANGQGKSRSHRGLANRPTSIWRSLFCSTGEMALADKVAEDGRKITAGQEVRVLDTPADAGGRFGCFENLHGLENDPELKTDNERGERFAEELRKAALQYYGTAIRAYLSQLTANLDKSIVGVEATIKGFLTAYCPSDADPQVRRACNRFALIAAGGELAIIFRIVP